MKARLFALTLVLLMIAGPLAAQNDKLGDDPDQCLMNYSLYREFYKQDNYKDALPWWKKTIETCPKYSVNLWINGEIMYKTRIEGEADAAKQAILIDSLMWIYDQRAIHFKDHPTYPEGYVLGQKAISILKYRKEDYQTAYKILKKSIELMGPRSSAAVILTYMQTSRQLFLDGMIDAEQVLNDYEITMEVAEANLKLTPDDEGFTMAVDGIESYFSTSGAANCDALISLYGPKFSALKDDIEWLNKITKQIRRAGCTDSNLFADASEALYALDPSAEAAYNLAAIFLRREDWSKASEYLENAIELGKESPELADMYYQLAMLNFQHFKEYQKARSLALNAIETRPNWGKPYLLIGQIYIAVRDQISSDDFGRKTVFWAAVDKFIKARSVDPDVSDEAKTLIDTYSGYFPTNEECFFRTMKDGDQYRVGGWINESTTVRSRKL